MDFKTTLRKGDRGDEVLYIKNCLLTLGQYKKSITKISNNRYGSDTVNAVKAYQRSHRDIKGNNLDVDGIVGKLTWAAIVRDYNNKTAAKINTPITQTTDITSHRIRQSEFPNLAASTISALNASWQGISEARIEVCKMAIKWAYDPEKGNKQMYGMYNMGADLYNKNLELTIYDATKIKKESINRAKYYTGGRLEMMLKMREYADKHGITLPSTDCSGQEIGIFRMLGYIKAKSDATANGLCGSGYSVAIKRDALQPGDFVGYDGHIGLYLGASLVCEAAGGAYGVQITHIDKRIRYDFVDGSLSKGKAWTKFRRCKFY